MARTTTLWETGAVSALVALLAAPLLAQEEDYGRTQIGGGQGQIQWESLLRGDDMDGWVADGEPWRPAAWSRNGDQILATVHQGRARLVQGDTSWVAYEFKVQVTVTEGFGFQIWFGLDGPMAYHLAWLGGWKAMALIDDHHDKLDVVNATA